MTQPASPNSETWNFPKSTESTDIWGQEARVPAMRKIVRKQETSEVREST